MDRFLYGAVLATIGLSLCTVAQAQTSFNLTEKQCANRKALQGYTWRSRTEVRVAGTVAKFTSHLVRYDPDGHRHEVLIGSGEKQPPRAIFELERVMPALNKVLLDRLVKAVEREVRAYETLSSDQLQSFVKKARHEAGTGELAGTERIHAEGVLKPADSLSVWVDPRSGLKRRVELRSTVDGKELGAVWTFAPLEDGTTRLAHKVIELPGRKLQIVTENSDFERWTRKPLTPFR
jgi:hypothetical protein